MLKYYKKYKWNTALLMLFSMIGVAIDIYAAFFIETITQTALNGDRDAIIRVIVQGICYVALIFANNYVFLYSLFQLRKKCMGDMRGSLFQKIMSLDDNTFQDKNSAHYISVITNDIVTCVNEYIGSIPQVITKYVLMIAAACVLIHYNPILAVIDIAVGVAALFIPQLTGKKIQARQKEYSVSQEELMNVTKDFLQGFSVVKSFRIEERAGRLYDQKNRQANAKYLAAGVWKSVSYAVSEGVTWFVFVVHMLCAAYFVTQGRMELAQMLGSMQVLNYLVQPINAIAGMMAEIKGAKASNERIASILEMESESFDLKEVSGVMPITVRHLSAGYEEGSDVLSDISYQFEAGKKYAIVGASGSGKSTLLKALMKYFKDYRGDIVYGGTEAREVDKKSVYENMSYIQQNVIIFQGTISENITMFGGGEAASVEQAAQKAGLQNVIGRFSQGLDGVLEEEGKNLSGGEKQRISIARAFYKKTPLILMDEATSSLDAHTARQIEESVLGSRETAAIVVTHKLSGNILEKYDAILVMKHGRIVEEGTFHELMDKKGLFYSLYLTDN